NLYVADTESGTENGAIRKITPDGQVTTLAGKAGTTGSADGTGRAARFSGPLGVAVDSAGNVYVADTWNCTVRRITHDGSVTTLAGLPAGQALVDGVGSAARFHSPSGLTVDGAGTVYVADSANGAIRQVTPDGVVTTLVRGQAGTNGMGIPFYPTGLTVDHRGVLYVTGDGDTVAKVTPNGRMTTLAGLAGEPGSADGAGGDARFRGPAGIAVDQAGILYVADSGNGTIRKITPAGVVSTLAG